MGTSRTAKPCRQTDGATLRNTEQDRRTQIVKVLPKSLKAGTFMHMALFDRELKNEVGVRGHLSYYFFTKHHF